MDYLDIIQFFYIFFSIFYLKRYGYSFLKKMVNVLLLFLNINFSRELLNNKDLNIILNIRLNIIT